MSRPFHLFERFGVELEYMIVDSMSLDVRPISDELLKAQAGTLTGDVDVGELTWSNELVLHVIELKTGKPAQSLNNLAGEFQQSVERINDLLAPMGARLMPSSMHPWMDPSREMRLWPHDYGEVYAAFDRVFDCRGHGWANLQSVHLNLPFDGDEEFGRLHAAIRLILPILPALAASSPIMDASPSGKADARLDTYRFNCKKIPSVAGRVIPEPVFTMADYRKAILEQIYRDLAPHDPEEILQDEWANSRGAIARFIRDTIEIRVLDIQECPAADIAILDLIIATLTALTEERWISSADQRRFSVDTLEPPFLATIRDGDNSIVSDTDYLSALGIKSGRPMTSRDVWRHLLETCLPTSKQNTTTALLEVILREGNLSSRILKKVGGDYRRERLMDVYGELCTCLAKGTMLRV